MKYKHSIFNLLKQSLLLNGNSSVLLLKSPVIGVLSVQSLTGRKLTGWPFTKCRD